MLRYAITDRSLCALNGKSEAEREMALLKQAERLARMGIDFLQLREKDLSARKLIALTRRLREVLRRVETPAGHGTRLLVNSRADVAAAAGADGVHLPSGEGQLTPDQARRVLRRAAESAVPSVVSVSCHSAADVKRARDGGADLILFGPVFGKYFEGELAVPAIGLDALRSACATAAGLPVLALGGVTLENAAECVAAGASGIAGIRLFL